MSALNGIRKLFGDLHQADHTGSGSEEPMVERSRSVGAGGGARRRGTDDDYVVVDHGSTHSSPTAENPRNSLASSRTLLDSAARQSADLGQRRTADAPMEWATSSVPINLGKAYSPILFFKLARAPPDPTSLDVDGDRQLYLIIATKGTMHVYENVGRSWRLVIDLYVPSQPRSVELVRIKPQKRRSSSGRDRSHSGSSGRGKHARWPSWDLTDLGIFVSLRDKERAVVISLFDSSVREVDAPPPLADAKRSGRSSRAANRGSMNEFPQGLSDDLVGGSVGSSSSGGGGSDGGFLADSKEGWSHLFEFTFGRRLLRAAAAAAAAAVDPSASAIPSSVLFLTKGRLTYVVVPPLGGGGRGAGGGVVGGGVEAAHSGEGSSSNRTELLPVHTFNWTWPPNRVVALVPREDELSRNKNADAGEDAERGQSTTTTTFPIVLVSFSNTGVEVQEGYVDVLALASSLRQQQHHGSTPPQPPPPTTSGGKTRPFFISLEDQRAAAMLAKSSTARGKAVEEVAEEPEGKALYDFGENAGCFQSFFRLTPIFFGMPGTPIGFLCAAGPCWTTMLEGEPRSSSQTASPDAPRREEEYNDDDDDDDDERAVRGKSEDVDGRGVLWWVRKPG
jgi:hypothetical protein